MAGLQETRRSDAVASAKARGYAGAKTAWRAIVLVQLVAATVAVYGAFHPSATMGLVLALMTLVVPFSVFKLKQWADNAFRLGEKARRLELLAEGLGRVPRPDECAVLVADAPTAVILERAPILPNFSSELPVGPERLMHLLQQSAFFTRRLAGLSARYCGGLASVGIGGTVLVLYLAVQEVSAGAPLVFGLAGDQLARVTASLLVFFVTGVFAEFSSAFSALGHTANSVFERCQQLTKAAEGDPWRQYLVLADYDTALAAAPPIPSTVYAIHRGKIEKAWREHMTGPTVGRS